MTGTGTIVSWFVGEEHESFHLESGPVGALLLHGFAGSPAELRPLARALADAGVSAHGILLPGFGADLLRLNQTRAHDWVDAALDAWDGIAGRYERTIVVGYSLGGSIALHVAARRQPDRVVLLAPLWKIMGGDPRLALLPLAKHVVRTVRPFAYAGLRDTLSHAFLEGAVSSGVDPTDPAVQSLLWEEGELSTAVGGELRRVSRVADRLAEGGTAPALIVQGIGDHLVRHVDTRDLATWFAGPISLHEVVADHLLLSERTTTWPGVRDLVVRFATAALP